MKNGAQRWHQHKTIKCKRLLYEGEKTGTTKLNM